MDPESFKGKVWLVAIDKLGFGLVIAVAYIAYHFYTLHDERNYNQAFRSAEYIRDLLPIVVDEHNDWNRRVYTFGALVDTGAITGESAVDLASQLVDDGEQHGPLIGNCRRSQALTADSEVNHLDMDHEEYLGRELMKTMPDSGESALHRYTALVEQYRDRPNCVDIVNILEAKDFWGSFLTSALTTLPAERLSSIDNPENLYELSQLSLESTPNVIDDLRKSRVESVRLVWALRDMSENPEGPGAATILNLIQKPIAAQSPRERGFTSALFVSFSEFNITTQRVVNTALTAMMARADSPQGWVPQDAPESIHQNAIEYMRWATEQPQVEQTVEGQLLSYVDSYDWSAHSQEPQTFQISCDTACEIVQMLIFSNCAGGGRIVSNTSAGSPKLLIVEPPSERVQAFLDRLFQEHRNVPWVQITSSTWSNWKTDRLKGKTTGCMTQGNIAPGSRV